MHDGAPHLPPGTPTPVDLLAGGTLPATWARRWAAEPDRPVLHARPSGWLVAGGLDRASAAVARSLAGAGVGPGDRVLLSAASSLAVATAHVAALRLGAVVVPANPAYREAELAHIVADARPRVAVVDDPERGAWVTAADPTVAVAHPADTTRLAPPRDVALDAAGPGDPALISYTSGTTGRPKGAVLSHGNLLAGAEALRLAWRWAEADRLLLTLPLFHMHGLGVGLHGTLLAGASAVVQPRFEVGAALDALGEHGCTLFFGVPTMYARLVASPRLAELGALRLCVSGSAPLAPTLFEAVAAATGAPPLERYGMTETLMLTSNPCEGERRAGTVGLPLPGVELRLAEGAAGEVLVRGPNVFGGYWGDDGATTAAFDPQGWFRTGDVGELAADGYLRLVGRAKELIITGGLNVYPREVEDALLGHPGVAEVAVAGVPSEEWGEAVVAFVVPDGPARPDVASLAGWAGERLAAFKRPKEYRFVAELPRNALGKVVRSQLTA